MITTIEKIADDAVRDWQEVFRRSPNFRVDYTGRSATLSTNGPAANPKRLTFPEYNVLQDTITCSDATVVEGYRPWEGDRMISDVVMVAAPTVGSTFDYTALKATLRGKGTLQRDLDITFFTPRLVILPTGHLRTMGDQVDDDGSICWARRLFIQIFVETDDITGGPNKRDELMGLAEMTIAQEETFLESQGYQFVKVSSATIEVPARSGKPQTYRGIIMASATIYPRVFP